MPIERPNKPSRDRERGVSRSLLQVYLQAFLEPAPCPAACCFKSAPKMAGTLNVATGRIYDTMYRRRTMSSSDFAWLVEHGPDLFDKYRGKWIAVLDEQVIGVGDTATEAAELAREKANDRSFILEGVDSEADVIYACL